MHRVRPTSEIPKLLLFALHRASALQGCHGSFPCLYCRQNGKKQPHKEEIDALERQLLLAQDAKTMYAHATRLGPPDLQPLLDIGYEPAIIWYAKRRLQTSRDEETCAEIFRYLVPYLKYQNFNALRDYFKEELATFAPLICALLTENQDLLRVHSQDLASVLQNQIASFLGK